MIAVSERQHTPRENCPEHSDDRHSSQNGYPGTPANPRLHTLVALAEVLGIPIAELLPPDPAGVAIGR